MYRTRVLKSLVSLSFHSQFESFDSFVERFCRFDDVVCSPEVGVVEVFHFVVEFVSPAERVASPNGSYGFLLPVGDDKFADDGEGRREEFPLPVAVEPHHVADVAQVGLVLLGAIVDDETEFPWSEAE